MTQRSSDLSSVGANQSCTTAGTDPEEPSPAAPGTDTDNLDVAAILDTADTLQNTDSLENMLRTEPLGRRFSANRKQASISKLAASEVRVVQ